MTLASRILSALLRARRVGLLAALTAAALVGPAAAAHASAQPPTLTEIFGSHAMPPGSVTNVEFIVANPNGSGSLSGISFSDTLPGGLQITGSSPFTNCDGTLDAFDAGSLIALSGTDLAAGASCIISVNVVGTTIGAKVNDVASITANESGPGPGATDTVNIIGPPTLTATFGSPAVPVGATTTLRFTVTNANTADLTSVGFDAPLPSGLVVATPNGLTGACTDGTITADAGSSDVNLSGATVSASSNCTFTVNVVAGTAGTDALTTSGVSSSAGSAGDPATASLTVVQPPTLATAFTSHSLRVGDSTAVTFTVANPNASTALSGVAFTDVLPTGLAIKTPNGLTGTCGGGTITANAGSSTISLSGATLAGAASCQFSANVVATSAGSKANTTGAVSSTESGNGTSATDTLSATAPPAVALAFGAPTVKVGNTTSLTLTLSNPAANPTSLTGIAVSDPLPAGLVVATPNGLDNECGGASAVATAGTQEVDISGASLAPGQSCTVTVAVSAVAAGVQTDTSGPVASVEGGTGAGASGSVAVPTPPSITAGFADATIAVGSLTSITYSVTNSNAVTLTGLAFSDPLPAGLSVVTLKSVTNACGGSVSAIAGSTSVSLSGGTLGAGKSCGFTIYVTATSAGAKSSTVSGVASNEAGTGPAAVIGLNVVAKSVTPAPTPTTTTPAPSPKPTTKGKVTKKKTVSCVIPKLHGRTLSQAKTLLKHAHCALGKVTHEKVHSAKSGRITAQSPKAGLKRKGGTKVAVTIAR